jgi:hypothetical protein
MEGMTRKFCKSKRWGLFSLGLILASGIFYFSVLVQKRAVWPTVSLINGVPSVEVEATVLSVKRDGNVECAGKCPGYKYPRDSMEIRIDRIISVANPSNIRFTPPQEGEQLAVNSMMYSAEPAIVKTVFAPKPGSIDPKTAVTARSLFADPIPKMNGYFVYTLTTQSPKGAGEKILPGLQSGSRFRANIYVQSKERIELMDYTIF